MFDDFYQWRLAALAEFQRVACIKEAFFRNGGKAHSFKVDIPSGPGRCILTRIYDHRHVTQKIQELPLNILACDADRSV